MITTATAVCNLALSRIGAQRISDYASSTTVEGQSCRLHFDLVRDGLLRRHQWDFAKTSALLSQDATPPTSEWAQAWLIPQDCERIIRISSGNPICPVDRFERRGRKLLTNQHDVVELIYVSNNPPIVTWDSLFVEAISLKLAVRICGDITQNPKLAAEITQEFEQLALPAAQTADAREAGSGENFGTADLISQSQLVRSRRRGCFDKYRPIADIP